MGHRSGRPHLRARSVAPHRRARQHRHDDAPRGRRARPRQPARHHPHPGAVQARARRAGPPHLLADHADWLSGRAAQGRRPPAARRHGASREIRHVEIPDQRAGAEISIRAARENGAGLQPFLYGPPARAGGAKTSTAMEPTRNLVQCFHATKHIDIIHRPRPEERAPERLSKDARISKDGHKRDHARGHPSRRPREERGLLRMRSEGLDSIARCDWFHGIDPLAPMSFSVAAWRRLSFITLIAALLLHLATPSLALDTVRLGKAVPNSFAFGAAQVGIDAKIFAGEGLDISVSSFRGDAQLQQSLAAGSVADGLGSGPGLGFRAKGAPMIGVAAMYGAPRNLALLVSAKSPIRSIADLKGKRIGVTTVGSLTDWLARELSRQPGSGSYRIVIAPLGQIQATLPATDPAKPSSVFLSPAHSSH